MHPKHGAPNSGFHLLQNPDNSGGRAAILASLLAPFKGLGGTGQDPPNVNVEGPCIGLLSHLHPHQRRPSVCGRPGGLHMEAGSKVNVCFLPSLNPYSSLWEREAWAQPLIPRITWSWILNLTQSRHLLNRNDSPCSSYLIGRWETE